MHLTDRLLLADAGRMAQVATHAQPPNVHRQGQCWCHLFSSCSLKLLQLLSPNQLQPGPVSSSGINHRHYKVRNRSQAVQSSRLVLKSTNTQATGCGKPHLQCAAPCHSASELSSFTAAQVWPGSAAACGVPCRASPCSHAMVAHAAHARFLPTLPATAWVPLQCLG